LAVEKSTPAGRKRLVPVFDQTFVRRGFQEKSFNLTTAGAFQARFVHEASFAVIFSKSLPSITAAIFNVASGDGCPGFNFLAANGK
jgi:hypothetical protein